LISAEILLNVIELLNFSSLNTLSLSMYQFLILLLINLLYEKNHRFVYIYRFYIYSIILYVVLCIYYENYTNSYFKFFRTQYWYLHINTLVSCCCYTFHYL